MSISLRKACQPALDAVNLSHVHVGVKNKTLTIVGPCGQPLVTVSGIEFDTNTPKKNEIPYALNLFEEFLSQKAEDIAVYLEKKKAFSELVKPDINEIPGLSTSYRTTRYSNENYEVSYNQNKDIFSINTRNSAVFTASDIPSLVEEANSVALPYFTALKAYNKKLKELGNLQSELQTCNI